MIFLLKIKEQKEMKWNIEIDNNKLSKINKTE